MSEHAPDSIDPYVGFKWLHVASEHQLVSHTHNVKWPHGEALEAVCALDWGYEWQIADSFTAQVPYKKGKQVVHYYGSSTSIASSANIKPKSQWWLGQTMLQNKPPKRPKLILPPGKTWSYAVKECPHDPVDEHCTCGIYVVDSQEAALGYSQYGRLLVKVALWGKVIIGDRGARGQYAYPLEICGSNQNNDEKMMEGVGMAYAIPFPGYAPPKPAPELHHIQQDPDLVRDGGIENPVGELERRSKTRIRTFLNL